MQPDLSLHLPPSWIRVSLFWIEVNEKFNLTLSVSVSLSQTRGSAGILGMTTLNIFPPQTPTTT